MSKAMSTATNSPRRRDAWTSAQAYMLAVFCLMLGVAIGYLFRGSASPVGVAAASSPASGNVGDGSGTSSNSSQPPDMAQRKEALNRAVAPLLAALQANADDFDTLTKVANLYYDAQRYPEAIQYYGRAVKIQPQNPDVLTDFGTSLWYAGDADSAIAQFQTALKYQPGRASTLFNLGIVKWQGKNDPKGAVQAWEELLQKNPDYPEKQQLQEFIQRAKQHAKG